MEGGVPRIVQLPSETHLSEPHIGLVPRDHCNYQVAPERTDAHVRVFGKVDLVPGIDNAYTVLSCMIIE